MQLKLFNRLRLRFHIQLEWRIIVIHSRGVKHFPQHFRSECLSLEHFLFR
jgi:hypothetical protein